MEGRSAAGSGGVGVAVGRMLAPNDGKRDHVEVVSRRREKKGEKTNLVPVHPHPRSKIEQR